MTRRVWMLGGVIAAVLLLSAQTAVPGLQVDLAAVLAWALKGSAAVIGGALLWVLKGAVQAFNTFKQDMTTRLDTLDDSIGKVQSDVQTTKQELFGATGGNGIRGELREIKADARQTKEMVSLHEVLLARLADKAGVPFKGGS